ncbi:MAG: hypothetical protein IKR74_02760 [Bacilli bacterium]|nr:hypothetical protein [Bacilli bacterium]
MYPNSLFSRIISGISSTLNIANKMIPLYEKAKPMTNSFKKIVNSFKQNNQKQIKCVSPKKENTIIRVNNPTFFK